MSGRIGSRAVSLGPVARGARAILSSVVLLCLLPSIGSARQSSQSSRPTGAGYAELEIVADSVGQPIFINGVQVGTTPAIIRSPAMSAAKVRVGQAPRTREVTLDIPARGRIRFDVTIPKDTLPLPMRRSVGEIERALRITARFPVPATPVAPVPPRRPVHFQRDTV